MVIRPMFPQDSENFDTEIWNYTLKEYLEKIWNCDEAITYRIAPTMTLESDTSQLIKIHNGDTSKHLQVEIAKRINEMATTRHWLATKIKENREKLAR